MQLLVSVTSADEAASAIAGGADIIDAKDPLAGALGAVRLEVLCQIHRAVAGTRLVTAALGDATSEAAIEKASREFSAAGAALVKVGFAGISAPARVVALIEAAVEGARDGGVVAVAYADADRATTVTPRTLIDVAASAGATGVLLDTIDKTGPGLRALLSPVALAAWVNEAHEAGLLVALAGKLRADDVSCVRDAGADVAGVRGAACEGGRTGRVAAHRVQVLRALCAQSIGATTVPLGAQT